MPGIGALPVSFPWYPPDIMGFFFPGAGPSKALGSGVLPEFRPMLGSALHGPLFQ